jgi:hypothetical protein
MGSARKARSTSWVAMVIRGAVGMVVLYLEAR